MRALLQRVQSAQVVIDQQSHSTIGAGLLILLGVHIEDTLAQIEPLVQKIVKLRIFADEQQAMNEPLGERDVMVVSQFTLYADTRKGNRPSWHYAAPGTQSEPLYQAFVQRLEEVLQRPVATGVFGADMQVQLVNDGPVTLLLES